MSADDHKKIAIDQVAYYFDGQQRDFIDLGLGNAALERINRIKRQLLAMPKDRLESVLTAMESLVGDQTTEREKNMLKSRQQSQQRQQETLELQQRRQDTSGTIASVSEVAPIKAA